MTMFRAALALTVLTAGAATAQTPAPAHANTDVIVRGVRSKPSGWREAETAHVVVQSDGPEKELVDDARGLERLHFLLSGLLGRPDVPDDYVKVRVTLIGDVAEFSRMDLRNERWQEGPFNDLFTISRYYDPRDTGAVMASTRVDQQITIAHTTATPERVTGAISAGGLGVTDPGAAAAIEGALIGDFATSGMRGPHDFTVRVGDGTPTIPVTATSLLYAGYAQHYLTTYFPAAYPRWYLDGFGQIFASMELTGDHVLTFGRSPRGTGAVLDEFGAFPLGDVLDDKYLTEARHHTRWTPIHAWLLVHFLFFSDTRRPQLRQYLALRAQGADARTAAAVFGDQRQLASELRAYFNARKPYEQVVYPAGAVDQPTVRRLSEGEAAFLKGRLELGARVTVPPAPDASTPPDAVKSLQHAHDEALRARDTWLARLQGDANRWSGDLDAQLLLAEAECRSGDAQPCVAAADRAVALAPADPRPLAWKGWGMALLAANAPAGQRGAELAAARHAIAAANHLNNDAVEPLLAYYQSFALAGEAPPAVAIDALQKAVGEVPNAPQSRLQLASALAARGQYGIAREVALPIAAGPYDSPERPAARAIAGKAGPTPNVPAPADTSAPAGSDQAGSTTTSVNPGTPTTPSDAPGSAH